MTLAKILSNLINKSLARGLFPQSLKRPKILHKNKLNIANYRLIYILQVISKVHEKVFYSRFYDFYLLDFFAQVIDTYDTDNNKAVDLVYLDFQKAFDEVPHERLMVKVNARGIQGDAARWIRNWLAGRRQLVCINQSYSNWGPVISGVTQDSVSGQLLFIIYINDLNTNTVSKMSKFADDTKLCHRARNPDDIMELQEDINKLFEWVNKWQMSFNVDKCFVMHIIQNNMQSNYNMSNQQLPTTDQQRDLGIIITKDLKWQKQTETDESCKTANRVPGFIAPQFQV